MTVKPNPADFSRNDREGEYTATIEVRGTIHFSIKASSAEDARRQADAEVERIAEEQYVDLDSVDEVALGYVRKDAPMFRVIREGKMMQVSRLELGDIPRAPDERGF